MKLAVRITLFLLLIAALPASLLAQFAQRGSIGGIVTDTTGGVVPGATVTLTDTDRNQTTVLKTNESGRYDFTQLIAGNYQVAVEATGFKKTVSDTLQVTTQGQVRYDAMMQIGAVTEQVQVSAGTPLIQSENVNVDLNIPEQQVETLPVNGRNWTSLTELMPGISTYPRSNINLGGTYEVGAGYTNGGADYSAGGNAEGSRDNGYYVNGVNANENYESGSSFQPSIESIGEVKIGVVDFSAQYGRDYTNINVSTKGGTDSFHGEAYDFFENDALDALVPISKAAGLLTKNAYRFNQFGGNIGGPVWIPKLLNLKNKAFFFVNYEQNPKSLTGPNNLADVPSVNERAGNFGELCTSQPNQGTFNAQGVCSTSQGQLYNPFTGNPVPYNNLVTSGLYNPNTAPSQVTGIVNLFPLPNVAPTSQNNYANYQYIARQAVNPYHLDTRFDYRIGSKDSMFVAWSKYGAVPDNGGGFIPNLSQAYQDAADKSYVVSADEAHTFTATLTNEFIFAIGSGSLSTLSPSELAYANSSANPFNQIFSNTGTGAGGNTGIMALEIYNYGPQFNSQPTAGFDQYFVDVNSSLQFNDNLSWVHGNHSFTFGFNYLRKGEKDFDNVRYVAFGCAPSPGGNCGNGPQIFTSTEGPNGEVGGDAFADTLLGKPTVIHQRFDYTAGGPFAPVPNLVIPYYGAYAADQWKVSPRVTMTYGLRYDLPVPPYATNNLCCAVYQATTNSLAIPGIAPGLASHYVPAPKTDFAPRFSVAWQQAPMRVIRAGYGLYWNSGASQISNLLTGAFYGGIPGGFYGQETDFSTPEQSDITQVFPASQQISPGTFPNPTGTGQGNYGANVWETVFYADKQSFRTPYVHRYLLDIQQEIDNKTAVTLTYLGAEGRNGWYYADENVPAYQTGWQSQAAFDAARPNNTSYFGDVYVQRAGLNSNYNAGIVKFEHRLNHGVQILSHYTFSKAMGTRGINGQGTQDVGWNYPQNVIRSYGETTSSHRHRFLFETIWQPQYEHSLPIYLRPALAGWHISAIATLESGDALTAFNGAGNQANDFAAYNGLGNLNVLFNPNLPHSQRTFSNYFNTSAFVTPPTGVQGTADPGIIRGPGQNNWDVSLGKNFNIYENLHAEFRADAFNAFNHTQWNSVSTQLNGSTGTFGQVNGSRDGRILQLTAKVVF